MTFALPQSFRDERWSAFERALASWLETPEGRFAAYWAERDRRAEQPRHVGRAQEGEAAGGVRG
jgi:hypothetical protein